METSDSRLDGTRWSGRDPVEVIKVLEERLAATRRELQEATGHPGHSDRPKRQRRTARRQAARALEGSPLQLATRNPDEMLLLMLDTAMFADAPLLPGIEAALSSVLHVDERPATEVVADLRRGEEHPS